MQCSRCARPLRPLFLSMVCDFCDGLAHEQGWERAWVVWRGLPLPADECVFRTREDAERWREAQGLDTAEVLPVCSPTPFAWRNDTAIAGDVIPIAHPVTIYADRRFPPGTNRACLAHV